MVRSILIPTISLIPSTIAVSSHVSILGFLSSGELLERLGPYLQQRYVLNLCRHRDEFLQLIRTQTITADCLLVEESPELETLLSELRQCAILLPIVILTPTRSLKDEVGANNPPHRYHPAEIRLSQDDGIEQLGHWVDEAIAQFLKLPASAPIPKASQFPDPTFDRPHQGFALLQDQQKRLAEKLRERLGYLGVYYKRDSRLFLRNLSPEEVGEVLGNLKTQYQEIVLKYFYDNQDINLAIDAFVNLAFFADVSVTQIVEIHMELMDEYSKQLKLEGRSEEILVDYRLTLLDIVAHLCEMYRRSIPRES